VREPPRIIIHYNDQGEKLEPFEDVTIDIPEAYMGVTMEHMGSRKAEMQDMGNESGPHALHFKIPSRGLIGFRNEFMTDTRGEGLIHSLFSHYGPIRAADQPQERRPHQHGDLRSRGLRPHEPRRAWGHLIQPGTKCYEA